MLGRNEVDSFEMTEIDVPTQDIDVKQLADIFLLVVATQVAILELLSYIGQFLIDSLLFEFAGTSISQVSDELDQPSHVGIVIAGAAEEAAS